MCNTRVYYGRGYSLTATSLRQSEGAQGGVSLGRKTAQKALNKLFLVLPYMVRNHQKSVCILAACCERLDLKRVDQELVAPG